MAVVKYSPQTRTGYMGLSSDTKPAKACHGDTFIETDTGKVFMFYNTEAWVQIALIPQSGWANAPDIPI